MKFHPREGSFMKFLTLLVLSLLSTSLFAVYKNNYYVPNIDWSKSSTIPLGETREDIFSFGSELEKVRKRGLKHAHQYPIEITGLVIPYRPMKNIFNLKSSNPFKILFNQIALAFSPIKKEEDIYKFLGLNNFNSPSDTGIYQIPFFEEPGSKRPFGAGLVNHELADAMNFSCAACHSGNLFGKTVVGMPNKTPRPYQFFSLGKRLTSLANADMFAFNTNATKAEKELYKLAKYNLKAVGVTEPPVLGLDTSLPHTSNGLMRRNPDAWATRNKKFEKRPRKSGIEKYQASSKPMPWWNLKYKTKWLSDGSVVAGNPLYMVILINEIGRGTDLEVLQEWLENNQEKVTELTTMVFAAKAPRYTDFFDVKEIDIEKAKRGEQHFLSSCKKCHGTYIKAWSGDNAEYLDDVEKLATTKVLYHEQTPVKDVGTDRQRWEAGQYLFKDLNSLQITKNWGVEFAHQEGYVPPPLEGIWTRWPYFHNNSIPNLCALMTPPHKRPKVFYVGEAKFKKRHFDQRCNGYHVGSKTPPEWKREGYRKFDTRRPGLSNSGHYRMFQNKDGSEKFSAAQKLELLEFLKTL